MDIKFKEELESKRLNLRITKPTIEMAQRMFKVIDENREHLEPWFIWTSKTMRVEDSMKYLFDKEEDLKEGKKVEYGIYVKDEYIGNIGVFDISKTHRSCEVGYWISKEHTRKGYVSEALQIIEEEFFNKLNFNRIQIKCDERNEASFGVAQKCGYVFEGKFREDSFSSYFNDLRNTLILSKLKCDYLKN